MKDDSSIPQLLRPTEAGRRLGVHPQTMANWRAEGRGPKWVKLGAAVRYSVAALEEFIEANTRTPGAAAR
jgi:predicted DNA-binding transcriptional regulator AlpA